MTVGSKKTEVENFDLTARDIPNFRRTPRIEKIEEVIAALMAESKIQKARIGRLELEREID